MLNTVRTVCNLCESDKSELTIADKLILDLPENESFGGKLKIVECQACGLRYLNPRPASESLPQIYNYDVYNDSTNNNKFLQEYFFELASKHVPEIENILEIGCGTGEFLAELERNGIQVSGVEFAESSQRIKFKGKLYIGRMEDIDISKKYFDVVYLLNVIEHLDDPLKVLNKIQELLKENGVLIMRHPNSDLFFNFFYKSFIEIPKYIIHRLIRLLGKRTGFTIVGFQNQHLFYFNRRTVENMLNKCGLKIEYFTTQDPFNKHRIGQSFRKLNIVEGFIATFRYLMSYFHLGPECIVVAKKEIS